MRKFNESDKINLYQESKQQIDEVKHLDVFPFPIDIFPDVLREFIKEVSVKANFSQDFISVSIMSVVSTVLGQKVELLVDETWRTNPIFWFAVVGAPGSKKSHPVRFVIDPLKRFDKISKEQYDIELSNYNAYLELNEHEKKQNDRIYKPDWMQYVVKDATSEALFYVHNINKNGILLYKDELMGWIKGMGQYKGGKGDEMEKFLSMFDGDELKINRVSKEPLFLDKTCMNLIGTIQNEVISQIPKDNGFLHRFLFTNTDSKIKRRSELKIDKAHINNYNIFLDEVKKLVECVSGKIIFEITDDASEKYTFIDNWICDLQESDDTEPFIVEYCEKLKTYFPRFCLLISAMEFVHNDTLTTKKVNTDDNWFSVNDDNDIRHTIEVGHMEKAFDLIKYFLRTAEILFAENKIKKEVKEVALRMNGKTKLEKIEEMYLKGIKAIDISKELDVSKSYVSKIIKNLNK